MKRLKDLLTESRPTNIFGIMGQLEKLPSIAKMVDLWSQADGMAGLYRTKDGNAYEITVRPAEYADHPNIANKTKKRKQMKTFKELNEELNEGIFGNSEKKVQDMITKLMQSNKSMSQVAAKLIAMGMDIEAKNTIDKWLQDGNSNPDLEKLYGML